MRRSLGELIILVAVSILVGLTVNVLSSNAIPIFGQWDSEAGSVHAGGPCKPPTKEFGEADIVNLFTADAALFVDARNQDDFIEGHIPRAVHLPLGRFDEYFPEFAALYPLETRIVCYCSGVDCHDSHDLAILLQDSGYTSVIVYAQGFSGWSGRNLPVEEGMGNE